MANKEERYKVINDLFQNIFKVTQNENVTNVANSEIKAMVGDGKWFIHVPGLCKIIIKHDDAETVETEPEPEETGVPIDNEKNVGFNAPTHKKKRPPRIEGDKFINDIAREYEE